MTLSSNPTKTEVNAIKTYIMNSFRYCKRISEGIESMEQFDAFVNLCQTHVDNCNFWCNKIKPTIGILQPNKKNLYENLYGVCSYTVDRLKDIINIYKESFEKAKEEAEMQMQLELSARINNEIALEYKDNEYKKLKESRSPIGFKINNNDNDTTKNNGQ